MWGINDVCVWCLRLNGLVALKSMLGFGSGNRECCSSILDSTVLARVRENREGFKGVVGEGERLQEMRWRVT